MRKILSISLSLLLFAATATEGTLYLVFKVKQADIIQEWCVNKLFPERGCHGKCYLNKNIAQQIEKSDSSQYPNPTVEEPNQIVMSLVNTSPIPTYLMTFSKNQFHYESLSIQSFPSSVFHPPDSKLS